MRRRGEEPSNEGGQDREVGPDNSQPDRPSERHGGSNPSTRHADHLLSEDSGSDPFDVLWGEMERIDAEINSMTPTLTVMFTEICSKDTIFLRYGDIEAYRILRQFADTCLAEVGRYQPVFIEPGIGGEILMGFKNSRSCLMAAVGFLKALDKTTQETRKSNLKEPVIEASVGVNRGRVLYNKGVLRQCNALNLGKRLQQLAEPSQILISQSAYEDLDGSAGFNIITRGHRQFKNIPDPQPVYEVYWREDFISAYMSGLVFETKKPDLGTPPVKGLPKSYQYAARRAPAEPDPGVCQPVVSPEEPGKSDAAVQSAAHEAEQSQEECPRDPEDSALSEASDKTVFVSRDGEPGCYPSIGEALAACEEGAEIVIRTGNYDENVFINVNDITIRASQFADVTIQPKSGTPVMIRKAVNVSLQGLALLGNHADIEQPACLEIESAENISVRDCVIRATPGTGSLIYSSNVNFKDTAISGCQRGGVFVRTSSEVTLEHCQVTDNLGCELHKLHITGCGILVSQSSVLRAENCVVGGNEGVGVSVVGGTCNADLKKCDIRGNGVVKISPGIYMEGAKGSVEHCQIRENGGAGIYAKHAAIVVKKNKIQSNGTLCKPRQPGIYLIESPKTKTLGNQLHGNGIDKEKHIRLAVPADETEQKGTTKEPDKAKASPMWFRGLRGGRRIQKPRDRQNDA